MNDLEKQIEILEARCSRYRIIIDSLGCGEALIESLVALGQLTPNDARYLLRLPEVESMPKPPLGVMPRDRWDKKCQAELVDAANRYMAAGKKIPKEWVEEYNELSERYGEDGSKSE